MESSYEFTCARAEASAGMHLDGRATVGTDEVGQCAAARPAKGKVGEANFRLTTAEIALESLFLRPNLSFPASLWGNQNSGVLGQTRYRVSKTLRMQ